MSLELGNDTSSHPFLDTTLADHFERSSPRGRRERAASMDLFLLWHCSHHPLLAWTKVLLIATRPGGPAIRQNAILRNEQTFRLYRVLGTKSILCSIYSQDDAAESYQPMVNRQYWLSGVAPNEELFMNVHAGRFRLTLCCAGSITSHKQRATRMIVRYLTS